MPKAYSYIRFSTPEQAQGDSLRRQTAAAEAWCAERGLEMDDTLRDLGVSAYHGANRTTGALRKFLELVETGRIERGSYLIVESLDRLSRETVLDAASGLFALINAGVVVVTLSDGQEYSADRLRNDWTPLVISLAVMARAHDESRMKSERVGKAWRQKKAAARDERRPLTPRGPSWLELHAGKWIEIPERVAIVRRIFQETIQGLGRREIVRRLNADRVPTFRSGENRKRTGEGWQESSVGKVQRNRAALGEYQPHSGTHRARNRMPEGDPIPDYYPAVIDPETFWQAQAALDSRREPRAAGRKGKSGAHVLQGLGRCGECGGPMHVKNKGSGPKGGIYLTCSRAFRNAGCDNRRFWRLDRLERDVLVAVGFLEPRAFAALDGSAPDLAGKAAAVRARLADAEARRKRLLVLYEGGDDFAADRYREVADEVKSIKAELRQAERETATVAADPGVAARLADLRELAAAGEPEDEEERRSMKIRLASLLRDVVRRVECYAGIGAVLVMEPLKSLKVAEGGLEYAYAFEPSRLPEGTSFMFQMRGAAARILLEHEEDPADPWGEAGRDSEHWDRAALFGDSDVEALNPPDPQPHMIIFGD